MILLAELCNSLLLFKHEPSGIQIFHYYFPNKYHESQIMYSFFVITDLYQFAQGPYFLPDAKW